MNSTHTLPIVGNSERILAVDDDQSICQLYRTIFSKSYQIETVQSGEQALARQADSPFDLILLDVSMPGLDGFDTCRHLRETTEAPIIFVTGRQGLDEHLRAYDAGGSDIITKPFRGAMLSRKVELALAHRRQTTRLMAEQASLHKMAMDFLSSVGETGTLLNFIRASVGCRTHRELAHNLVAAMSELGLNCCVQLRHRTGPTALTTIGEPTPLESSVLEQIGQMGRIFQFHRRLAVNYDRISIVVNNLPEKAADVERTGRLRDAIVVLAETTEGLCETVDMRIESMHRAEQLQLALGATRNAVAVMHQEYFGLLGDVRLSLDTLFEKLDQSLTWLGLNQKREEEFLLTVHAALDPVMASLEEGSNFESHFGQILNALKGEESQDSFELFDDAQAR